MKKSIAASLCAAGALALAGVGCTNIETNRPGSQLEIVMPVVIQPEIEVGAEQISGSATIHSILGIFSWGVDSQAVGVDYGVDTLDRDLLAVFSSSDITARNAAMYDAVTKGKADVMMAPQYVLTVDDYFFYKSINCKVKGYPGVLKGVKVVQP